MPKTATVVGRGHLFHHSVLFVVFSFSLLSFHSSIYSSTTISKRDAIVTEKHFLDWVSCCKATWGPIVSEQFCPLHKAKLRRNNLFIDQSAFSNCALYVISKWNGLYQENTVKEIIASEESPVMRNTKALPSFFLIPIMVWNAWLIYWIFEIVLFNYWYNTFNSRRKPSGFTRCFYFIIYVNMILHTFITIDDASLYKGIFYLQISLVKILASRKLYAIFIGQ